MSDLIHPHDHFFRDVFSRPDTAADFLRYLSQATDRLTPADLRQVVNQTLLPRGDVMPTIAEQWVMEGQASLLKRLLKRRFGTLPPAVETKLDGADQAQLEVWGEQLLDAKNLEEVFRKPD